MKRRFSEGKNYPQPARKTVDKIRPAGESQIFCDSTETAFKHKNTVKAGLIHRKGCKNLETEPKFNGFSVKHRIESSGLCVQPLSTKFST
ncbi:MAG: hypothetical protein ACOX88_02945 [Christensenellales bacterium]